MQVKTILEQIWLNRHPGMTKTNLPPNTYQIVEDTWDSIFSFSFPIWDEADREPLCCLILLHYYMREIGQETIPLWLQRLQVKMLEIMPYYVEMWNAQQAAGNWFINNDMSRDYTRTGSEENNGDIRTTDSEHTTENTTSQAHTEGKTTGTSDGTLTGQDKTVSSTSGTRDATTTTDGTTSGESHDTGTTTGTSSNTTTSDTTDNNTRTLNTTNTRDGNTSGSNDQTTTGSGTDGNTRTEKLRHSDTPQNGLTPVENGTYLSAADVNDKTDSGTHSSNEHVEGSTTGTEHATSADTGTIKDDRDINNTTESNGTTGGTTKADGTTSGSNHEKVVGEETTSANGTSTTDRTQTTHGDTSGTSTGDTTGSGSLTGDRDREGSRKEKFDKGYGEDYNERVKGWNGDKIESMYRLQNTYMNIPQMIIADLNSLFIGILW